MTGPDGDPTEGSPEHPDSPEQAAVRARLGAEPAPRMPPEVAARLQEAMRGESQARAAAWSQETAAPPHATYEQQQSAASNVVPLRSRRRWVAPLAAAAAVVAVVGIGIPVIQSMETGGGDDDGSSASGGYSTDSGRDDGAYSGDAAPEDAGPDNGSLDGDDSPSMPNRKGPPELYRVTFGTDVLGLIATTDDSGPRSEVEETRRPTVECRGDQPRGEESLTIRLDGDPAQLAATSTDRGTLYRAYVCEAGEPTVAAETTVDGE